MVESWGGQNVDLRGGGAVCDFSMGGSGRIYRGLWGQCVDLRGRQLMDLRGVQRVDLGGKAICGFTGDSVWIYDEAVCGFRRRAGNVWILIYLGGGGSLWIYKGSGVWIYEGAVCGCTKGAVWDFENGLKTHSCAVDR